MPADMPGKIDSSIKKKFEPTDQSEAGIFREFKKEEGKPRWLKEKEERKKRYVQYARKATKRSPKNAWW